MQKTKIFIKSILIPVIVGGVVGIIISNSIDYNTLQKPLLSPPSILFPIVWTILYILMGISYGILELNINKAEYQSMMTLDADIKEANTELNSEFEKDFSFVKKDINAPKDLRDYGVNKVVMTRKDFSDKDYSIAHDYIWDYSNEAENRTIRIAFSKIGKPLRDYYLSSEEKISKIENTDVIITQYEDLYLAEFKLNDVYFDIETAGITQKELVDLLVSIIK